MKRLALLLALTTLVSAEEFQVNLKDPVFSEGVLRTESGGVISAPGFRLQAEKISYTDREEKGAFVRKVIAEGNLLLECSERFLSGSYLEYDLVSRTGILYDGKTFLDIWFIGAEKIELASDGSFLLYGAYLTTSESEDRLWDMSAKSVCIDSDEWVSAKNLSVNFARLPIFWLPAIKGPLKFFTDPPVRYKLIWDKGLGPRLSMRYRIISTENSDAYFRLDYRLDRGFGAALETDYCSPDERTFFQTKSYGAHDKSVPDEKGNKRYRLQGIFQSHSVDEKTRVEMSYDKMRDDKMPEDFKSDDFEINTQKRSKLFISHVEDNFYSHLSVIPRLNPFQSLNQELPLLSAGIRPFEIGCSGILSENTASAGFLDYVYATSLKKLIPSTHSARLETRNSLYRPFHLGAVNMVPSCGVIGIFYNNSPHHSSVAQGIFSYSLDVNSYFSRSFSCYKHLFEPYASFIGLTRPTINNSQHFIFNIDDGWEKINELEAGVRNRLYPRCCAFLPCWTLDLYTRAFFHSNTYTLLFPKAYLDLSSSLEEVALLAKVCWNMEEKLLDFINLRALWTLSESIALGCEYRHRSSFDFRKADHQSFLLDMARSIEELIHSPLSDKRDTFLAKLQVKITPKWTVNLESHSGWNRKSQPHYNSIKVSLLTLLTTGWQLTTTYQHSPNDDRISWGLSLIR